MLVMILQGIHKNL